MRSLLLALFGLVSGSALAEPSCDVALPARLDAVIERAITEKRLVGTVVLVARDGQIIYRRAAGLADREAGKAMSENAIFRFASVSKPIVMAAFMRMVEQGRFSLSDSVTRYLPDFRPRLADGSIPTITLHQLATHSSGLSYRLLEPVGSPYHDLDISDGLDQPGLTLAENLRRLGRAPLAFPPGQGWRYSLGIDVIGGVMEAATGETLPALIERLVTGPLGMADTGFGVSDAARLAVPYADGSPEPVRIKDGDVIPLFGGAVRFSPSRVFDPGSYASGGAGMTGSAPDFLRFLEALRTGGASILSRGTVERMAAPQIATDAATQGPGWGFGYGWAVLVDPKASGTPQSSGTLQWGGVYGHNWFVDPAARLSVVALTNTAFEGMSGRFTVELRDAIYGPEACRRN